MPKDTEIEKVEPYDPTYEIEPEKEVPPHQHWHSDLIDKHVIKTYPSDPSGTTGELIYQTTQAAFRGYDGIEWKDLAWDEDIPTNTERFGGDGSDGALTASNEIDLGNVAIFVKNYSSINIGVGETVKFINPHANGTIVIFKCSGNCTIAGELRLGHTTFGGQTGAIGGTGGAANHEGDEPGENGTIGNDPTGKWDTENYHGGDFGEGSTGKCGGGGGGGGQIVDGDAGSNGVDAGTNGDGGLKQDNFNGLFNLNNQRKTYFITCGAGGGGGAGGSGDSGGTAGDGGNGGRGGGTLILEVAGNLNVTNGSITANGADGEDGENGGNCGDPKFPRPGGAGGGGAGGTVIILYKGTLTGTLIPSVAGGVGGSGGECTVAWKGGNGGDGSDGSYIFEQYIW